MWMKGQQVNSGLRKTTAATVKIYLLVLVFSESYVWLSEIDTLFPVNLIPL
jgi:hypothetical protein